MTTALAVRDQRADLTRRAERAMQYAEEAEAAGDTDRLEQAIWRYFWRLAQLRFLRERPPDADCPHCEQGENWTVAPDFWRSEQRVMVCLDHADEWTRREADVQLAIWKEAA